MKKTNKQKAVIDDGFQPELVKSAHFEGVFEMPALDFPKEIIIPDGITPFSRQTEAKTGNELLGFFELDFKFANVLRNPDKYIDDFRKFIAVIPPDCSLYRDAPLYVQLLNIARNRIMGHYFQTMNLNVYPLVRWGNEETYTTCKLPEAIAFAGIPHNSLIVISTYGCIKTKNDKYHFEAGLEEGMKILTPRIVLVHGAMPDKIFSPYLKYADFHHYSDWIRRKKGGENG